MERSLRSLDDARDDNKGARDDRGDSPFRKGTKGNVLSFGANERTKESIHLPQGPSLYGGDATDNLGKPQILRLH